LQLPTDSLVPVRGVSQLDSLPCRLVHFRKTLSLLSMWSKVYMLPMVANFMAQELVARVAHLGVKDAPGAFAFAMAVEVTGRVASEDDVLFGELITVLMRYFAHLFGHEMGPEMQGYFL
jgi:hypothetical protein